MPCPRPTRILAAGGTVEDSGHGIQCCVLNGLTMSFRVLTTANQGFNDLSLSGGVGPWSRWCSLACLSRADRCFSDSCHALKPLAVMRVSPFVDLPLLCTAAPEVGGLVGECSGRAAQAPGRSFAVVRRALAGSLRRRRALPPSERQRPRLGRSGSGRGRRQQQKSMHPSLLDG